LLLAKNAIALVHDSICSSSSSKQATTTVKWLGVVIKAFHSIIKFKESSSSSNKNKKKKPPFSLCVWHIKQREAKVIQL